MVLAVIVTLALVLTPSIINFINDSRVARARTDTQTLSASLIQFYRDNGFFPQWSASNAGGPGTAASKVDLLVSIGNVPSSAAANVWTTGTNDRLDELADRGTRLPSRRAPRPPRSAGTARTCRTRSAPIPGTTATW